MTYQLDTFHIYIKMCQESMSNMSEKMSDSQITTTQQSSHCYDEFVYPCFHLLSNILPFYFKSTILILALTRNIYNKLPRIKQCYTNF